MKKITSFLLVGIFGFLLFSSFNTTDKRIRNNDPINEYEVLVKYLEANGNFINNPSTPSLIYASELKENIKNTKYLILDIRSKSWFEYGHIKNAKNVEGPKLLDYFEKNITPSNYDKITIICYSGQSAAHYAGLLRIAGYNNVYSLNWGMSSWGSEFSNDFWTKNSSNTYANKLETISSSIPQSNEFPTIKTGKTEAKDILKERLKIAFAKPYKEHIVKADAVFENPSDYYIVDYVNENVYNFGHIKGSYWFQPNKSLSSTTNLYNLPASKKILINSLSGQSGAYTVAYLEILGYDVYNLGYGLNSYMNKILVEKNWDGFSPKQINEFPVVE